MKKVTPSSFAVTIKDFAMKTLDGNQDSSQESLIETQTAAKRLIITVTVLSVAIDILLVFVGIGKSQNQHPCD